MRRLKAEREGGYTQAELARETIEAARRDGKEIESARGYGDRAWRK